jgi:uncharacterized protein with FMN-binding domain
MRRILFWFLSTVTVLVLLFGYHTSTEGIRATASVPAIVSSTPTATPGTGTTSGSTSTGRTTRSRKASHPSTSPSATPTPASSTATGTVAATQWGPVQVELTVKAGAITDVSVLQYPSGNSRDAEINNYALPILIRETMSAQDAKIDMVSGATVTSTGYLQSLQSALDRSGL